MTHIPNPELSTKCEHEKIENSGIPELTVFEHLKATARTEVIFVHFPAHEHRTRKGLKHQSLEVEHWTAVCPVGTVCRDTSVHSRCFTICPSALSQETLLVSSESPTRI